MAFTETLRIIIDANTKGFVAATKQASDSTKRMDTAVAGVRQKIGGFAKAAAVGLAGVGIAAVAMGDDLVRAAEESNKVSAQTDAVLKSMGLSARVSADQIAKLSQELSAKSGIDDEVIQSGENVLLTFRSVAATAGQTGGAFDRATQAALDMSVALGQDMQTSVIQVGKALNDPIRGLASLRRVGIQFTQQQETQIKAMVAAGDQAGAMNVILKELERQFGGSAEAQATASGKLSVAWENLQETLGEKLLPVVERFANWLTNTGIPALEAMIDWISRNKSVLLGLAVAVATVVIPVFVAWAAATIAATWPLLAIGAAVGVLAVLVVKHFDTIKNTFETVFNWLKRNWPLLVAIIAGPIGVAVLAIVKHWDKIKGAFQAGVNFVLGLWRTGWMTIRDFVVTVLNTITGAITTWRNRIVQIFSNAVTWLASAGRNIIKGLWNGILLVASQMFGYLGRIGGRVRDLFVNAGKWLFNAGKQILQGLWDGLKDKWHDVTDWIGGLAGKIRDLKGPPAKDLQLLRPAGRAIMGGFFEELKRGQGPIFNLMKKMGSWIAAIFGGGGAGGGRGVQRWRNVALAALAYTGQSASWLGDLLTQMAHESGGNQFAINKWDINAQRGDPSRGLMQTIGATFRAYAGELAGRGIYDPFANIVAAIRYTLSRYGTLGAWSARGFRGYGTGGVVPGPVGAPVPATVHGGEGIFTPTQMRALSINGGGGTTTVVNVTVHGSVIAERELVSTINRQLSRGTINKNGRAL